MNTNAHFAHAVLGRTINVLFCMPNWLQQRRRSLMIIYSPGGTSDALIKRKMKNDSLYTRSNSPDVATSRPPLQIEHNRRRSRENWLMREIQNLIIITTINERHRSSRYLPVTSLIWDFAPFEVKSLRKVAKTWLPTDALCLCSL